MSSQEKGLLFSSQRVNCLTFFFQCTEKESPKEEGNAGGWGVSCRFNWSFGNI